MGRESNMAVVSVCPSDNDPCTALHLLFLSGARHTLSVPNATHYYPHTHGYGSVRQFIWESTVPSAAWKHERRRDAHNNMHVRSRCLLSLCGQPAAVLLCSVWSLSLETTCTARRRRCSARKNVSLGVFTRAKQLFMNELKLKMAVDARRKWLPREKVMPGKPGGDDGDAHTRGPIGEQCARPSPASLVVRNSPATHGRRRSMARDCGLLACRTGIKDCAQISDLFILLNYCRWKQILIQLSIYLGTAYKINTIWPESKQLPIRPKIIKERLNLIITSIWTPL